MSLESDDLNTHECMATLCGVIHYMVDKRISPAPDQEIKDAALPRWMESIQKCLTDSNRPHNVRLFLLKLILNVQTTFRPYACHWVDPILKVRSTDTIIVKNMSRVFPFYTYFKSMYIIYFLQKSDVFLCSTVINTKAFVTANVIIP